MMRHEHLLAIKTWLFAVQSSPAGLITPWLVINPDIAHDPGIESSLGSWSANPESN